MFASRRRLGLYGIATAWLVFAIICHFLKFRFNPSIFTIIFSIIIFAAFDFKNAAHLMWVVGLIAFVIKPVIAVSDLIPGFHNGILISLFSGSLLFLVTTEIRKEVKKPISRMKNPLFWFILTCIFVLIVVFALPLTAVALYLFPLMLIVLNRALRGVNLLTAIALLVVFIASITIYALFAWSGAGRLIIFIWYIFGIWMFWNQFSLPFGKTAILTPIFVADFLPGVMRRGNSIRDGYLSGDIESNLSPLIMVIDFQKEHRIADWGGLSEQFMLFFFSWVPRGIWAEKPYGFGFKFTVNELSPEMIDKGHSVASTYLGEHLYFIGEYGYISSFLAVIMVAILYRVLIRFSNERFPLYFFATVHLPTFVWGGIAAYSSRVWIGMIAPISLYLLFQKLIKVPKHSASISKL